MSKCLQRSVCSMVWKFGTHSILKSLQRLCKIRVYGLAYIFTSNCPLPSMRRIVTIVGFTGVLGLHFVLIGGAEERWVLWQEEFRPSGENRWTPVGTDPSERECEALKRYILGDMSREPDVRVTDDMMTQTGPGGRVQSRLICLPQSVNPKPRR